MPLTLTVTDNADGTGGVATIAGSFGANSVYYALWTGSFGALTWVLAGTRTNDGTVAVNPGNGFYLWQVLCVTGGSTTQSNPVWQNLTNATIDTPPVRIRHGVVQRVKNLNLTGLNNLLVLEKWLPRALDKIDTFPTIMICPVGPEDFPGILTGKDDIGVPMLIAIIDKQSGDFTANLDRNENWRWLIISAFRFQPLAGVPEVIQTFPEPTVKIDPGMFDKNLFFGPIVMRFLTRTTRG